MILTKKELKQWIKYEKKKYGVAGVSSFLKIHERDIIFSFQKRLRKTEYYFNSHKRIRYVISRLKLQKLERKYCYHIPLNVCGKGLKLMHLGPILINGNASIGNDCSIHINTSIVAGGTNDNAPIIGNNVIIGVGAVVLGDVKIADYIAIGANAVVNKSFLDENIAIAGVPAKKISNNGAKEWNKNHLS